MVHFLTLGIGLEIFETKTPRKENLPLDNDYLFIFAA